MLQQAYTPSNTGIASFVHASADYDLAPIGIGSMREQVDRLAEFGRNGDIYVVHAAEGETVIPMEVLDANPQVKEMLFSQMRDMGLDPERYVVGNELNSINPDTGMPEFFSFKKAWKSVKKVFKAVAPILATVVGNAILPGIGGILASMAYTKLSGGSWGDTLKAGIMSYAGSALMAGFGGIGDPGGFMGGLEMGLTAPFGAVSNLSGSWDQGVFGKAGAGNAPGASLYDKTIRNYDPNAVSYGTTAAAPIKPVTTTALPGSTSSVSGIAGSTPSVSGTAGSPAFNAASIKPVDFIQPTAAQESAFFVASGGAGDYLMPVSTANPGAMTGGLTTLEQYGPLSELQRGQAFAALNPVSPTAAVTQAGLGSATAGSATAGSATAGSANPVAKPSFLERVFGDTGKTVDKYMFGGGNTPQDILDEQIRLGNIYKATTDTSLQSPAEYAKAIANAQPNMIAKYGPSLALAGGAAYLGGMFDAPEDPDKEAREEAQRRFEEASSPSRRNELLRDNPEQFEIADLDPYKYRPAPNPRSYQGTMPVNFARAAAPSTYMRNSPDYARYSAAGGGFIDGQPQYLNYGGTAQYPRREMLVEGPGTERSDDIPAMLSDGEFVLNSRSVRGADPTGQGNRYRGAQNLYNMMRNFEMKG
jgi:hypothetical protein